MLHTALDVKPHQRTIILTRSTREESLNFSILGGQDMGGFGVYVCDVKKGSRAEELGLRRGDQILQVKRQLKVGGRGEDAAFCADIFVLAGTCRARKESTEEFRRSFFVGERKTRFRFWNSRPWRGAVNREPVNRINWPLKPCIVRFFLRIRDSDDLYEADDLNARVQDWQSWSCGLVTSMVPSSEDTF